MKMTRRGPAGHSCFWPRLSRRRRTFLRPTGHPERRHNTNPIAIRPAKPPKPVKFAGVVLSANVQSITVRSNENQKVIRTFTFAPAIQAKMQQIA